MGSKLNHKLKQQGSRPPQPRSKTSGEKVSVQKFFYKGISFHFYTKPTYYEVIFNNPHGKFTKRVPLLEIKSQEWKDLISGRKARSPFKENFIIYKFDPIKWVETFIEEFKQSSPKVKKDNATEYWSDEFILSEHTNGYYKFIKHYNLPNLWTDF